MKMVRLTSTCCQREVGRYSNSC